MLINVIVIYQVENITDGAFLNLKHLIILKLDGNRLENITDNMFHKQKSLEVLGKLLKQLDIIQS